MALWLVLEWYGTTSEVPWLFLLAAWVLAYLIGAAAYAWWNRSGLELHLAVVRGGGVAPDDLSEQLLRTAPQPPLFEDDAADFEVGLDTRRRAKGPAWISGEIGSRRLTAGTGLVPKAGWRHRLAGEEMHRGPLGATAWTINTSDPLGFFIGQRTCADEEIALVYPRFASLSKRRPVRELETAAAAPRAGSGTELFGIREYRAGDSLRRIHWRSSARHGELVVREYEPPGVQIIRIAVDPQPRTRQAADQIARIAASEAWDCLREGGLVRLGNVESRDLWELLDWLARYPAVDFGDETSRADVVVTADPELLETLARRNWLIGDAPVNSGVAHERVGFDWPLP